MLGKPNRTKLIVLSSITALTMALAAPALAAADWGAIAVNPKTGKVGVSYDYPTAHRAKKRARAECHQWKSGAPRRIRRHTERRGVGRDSTLPCEVDANSRHRAIVGADYRYEVIQARTDIHVHDVRGHVIRDGGI